MAEKLISTVKINNTVYYIKDETARSNLGTLVGTHALEALGTAAWLNSDAEVSDGKSGVPTTSAVKSYVDAQVGSISKFDVVVVSELPTASADTMYKIYLIPHAHGEGDAKDEYLTVRSGAEGSYTYAWEKIGNTDIDLTGYVPKTRTIATVDLADDISKEELQTALGLEGLAYADSLQANIPAQTVTGVKASGTVKGSITVNALTQTATLATISSKADYTPAGSVSGTVSVPSSATASATEGDEGYQVAGVVSKPDITLTSQAQAVITGVSEEGTLPSWEGASYSAPSLGDATSASFATKVLKPTVDEDNELLSFGWVSEGEDAFANAITDRGTFSAGSVDFGTFNAGSMPTFSIGNVQNISKAELVAAPTFTGSKFKIDFTNSNADINAIFTGTKATGLIPSEIKYNQASQNGASFTGESASFDVGDITIPAQDITITPSSN